MTGQVFDTTPCALGEGPLWHPGRRQLYWFDIIRHRLHTQQEGKTRTWQFDQHVSAAGWVDNDRLLIASETGLFVFDLTSGQRTGATPCEADRPGNRSNDGRADPYGGFWFGTMGKAAEPGAGAVYRWYQGTLERVQSNVTIPNAICFSPDGARAYFGDTAQQKVFSQSLDSEGWPSGPATLWRDFGDDALNPDGAVTDADGNLWIAFWGSSYVGCFAPDGTRLGAVRFPARHTSCPAFGGEALTTLYCTSARQGLSAEVLKAEPENGMTFAAPETAQGRAEPQVRL